MNTIEIVFAVSGDKRELLLAQLINAGCEAFEETDDTLLAFVPEDRYNRDGILAIAAAFEIPLSERSIPPQNWNAEWETSFKPVVVPHFCTVRASFHPPVHDTPYEVIVTPKMSFGTGHHATTRLMMTAMQELDFNRKTVLDFGTGTGILAILAAKLGASVVSAIDNDSWSVENALENTMANDVAAIRIAQGSLEIALSHAPFDFILANINRHILLQYMAQMCTMLLEGGVLLLSGILTADEAIVREVAEGAGLEYVRTLGESEWIAMKFTAQSSTFPVN